MMESKKMVLFLWILCFFCFISFADIQGGEFPQTEIPPETTDNVQQAIKSLFSPEPDIRAASAFELGEMGDRAVPAIPFLVGLLDDTVEGQLPDHSEPTSPALEARKALVKIGQPAVVALIGALKHDKWIIRSEAAEILGDLKARQARLPLISAMNDKNPLVGKSAAVALGKIDSQALINALNHEKTRVRASAAWALGEMRIPSSIQSLIASLEDKNTLVRGNAVEALGNISDRAATPFLAKKLKDKNRVIREKAALALGAIGDPQAVEDLIDALMHEDWATQWKAALALGMIKDERAFESLVLALKNRRAEVRFSAAWALGEMNDPRAVKYLIPLLEDGHVTVQQKAGEALKKITGKDF